MKQQIEVVPKKWGKEIIFCNNEKYCGKLLCFNAGSIFSMHFHIPTAAHITLEEYNENVKIKLDHFSEDDIILVSDYAKYLR